MATLKDKISKGLTTINVKTNNFMEQNKIHTHISTIEREIHDLKVELSEIVYTKWMENTFEISCVEEILCSIERKYEEIEIQKKKMEQIALEEQQILGTMSTAKPQSQSQQEVKQDTIFCGSCGAQNAGNYKFCVKCGSPL